LLDFLAAAVRAEDFPFFVVDEEQDLGRWGIRASSRKELIGKFSEPRRDEHNMA